MTKFAVTFGQKYATIFHPVSRHIHPDGYLTVEAADMREARTLATTALGIRWSDIYNDIESYYWPTNDHFPLGEIGVIHSDGSLSMKAESV